MLKFFRNALIILVILTGLSACATSVKRLDSVDDMDSHRFIAHKFDNISVNLAEEVRGKLGEDTAFNPDEFQNTVKKKFEESALISATSEYSVEINVTDVRTRSTLHSYYVRLYGR